MVASMSMVKNTNASTIKGMGIWKNSVVFSVFNIGAIIVFFCAGSVDAQSTSYQERLSQISAEKINSSLGTISSQDKKEAQKRDLANAYTYIPKEAPVVQMTSSPVMVSQGAKQVTAPSLEVEYGEYRKKHHIADYIGDSAVKDLIKKAKDDKVTEEAVKIVEAEKLLFDSYSAFYKEKEKAGIEKEMVKSVGIKEDPGQGKDALIQANLSDRIDLVGNQTAGILRTSLDKLTTFKALSLDERQKGTQYMASGGRIFPGLELEENKDLPNVRGYMLEKVQKELMAVMANAINQRYHKEQGETAKEEIKDKEQLLAFESRRKESGPSVRPRRAYARFGEFFGGDRKRS